VSVNTRSGLALSFFLLHNDVRLSSAVMGETMTSERTFELLGHDFGSMFARGGLSVAASADKLSRCSAQAVGSNNARRVLAAQPRSLE
jgi:hypothetical protein